MDDIEVDLMAENLFAVSNEFEGNSNTNGAAKNLRSWSKIELCI